MSILDALAHWMLPAPAAHVLDVAEQVPAAVAAFAAEWNAGRGPIAALQAFAERTNGKLDDQVVDEIEIWLRTAIAGLDRACAAGAWLSEREPSVRAAVDAAFGVVFGTAFQAAALRNTLQRWIDV